MTCPFCRSHSLVEIGMRLNGNQFMMHSCPACERRWWDREGQQVALRSVLDLVSAR